MSTATREIEKNAGAKRSLISYHFKNKEEFWKSCMRALFSRFKREMQEKSKQEYGMERKTRLNLLVGKFLRANASVPEVGQVLADEFRREGWRQRWLLENYYREFFWIISQVYLQEQRRTHISGLSLTHFYYLIVGTMSIHSQAITHEILTGEDPNQSTHLLELSSVLTNILKTSID